MPQLRKLSSQRTSSKMALNCTAPKSFASIVLSNSSSFFLIASSALAAGPGIIETETAASDAGARRRTICVANLVHSSDATGKESPVKPSKRDDFPLDWSPTTTSYSNHESEYLVSPGRRLPRATYLWERNILIDTQLPEPVDDS